MAGAYSLAIRSLRAPIFPPKQTLDAVLRQRLHRSSPSFAPNTRGFHATSSRSFLDACVPAHSILENVHSITGLSWAATIPVTAALVFACTRGLIAQYIHKVVQSQGDLEPHLVETRLKLENRVMREDAHRTAAERGKRLDGLFRDTCTAVRKSHNCQHWKLWLVFTEFPIWYVMMETIRRMTGTEEGFIGLVWSVMGKRDYSGFPEPSTFVEPSLATEGVLWFTNLQTADPYLILPFILSATLFIRARYDRGTIDVVFEPRMEDIAKEHAKDPEMPNLRKKKLRRQRIAKVLALAAGPATLQFPSAMLLYWIAWSVYEDSTALLLHIWRPFRDHRTPLFLRPDVKKQRYRGPRMQDLRSPKKGKSKLRHL